MIGVFQGPVPQSREKKGRADREGFSAANQGALQRRLKDLLVAQQTRLDSYLAVLDKQYAAIEHGETEVILFYVELEEKIGRELFSIQKAVLPLDKLYRATKVQWIDITALKAILETRKEEVGVRLKRNRDLLAKQMTLLRSQIQTLRTSPLRRTSVYASAGIPSCLDIRL
ncbi:MAG: flagellar biosynthesis protein FlgN [Treponema sp.]|jgi:hypothetical protein|nr:flagellar biosynthesis protein FlgN [Treponema sp.]